MATKKKGSNMAAGLGAGLATLAAAAAGAYFLYGKDASKQRKKVKGWMLKAKGEVLEQLEKMKDISQETYDKTVDKMADKYKNVKNIDTAELTQMVKEIKGHWKSIKKQIEGKPTKKVKAKK